MQACRNLNAHICSRVGFCTLHPDTEMQLDVILVIVLHLFLDEAFWLATGPELVYLLQAPYPHPQKIQVDHDCMPVHGIVLAEEAWRAINREHKIMNELSRLIFHRQEKRMQPSCSGYA